ncbi:MAG TPA: Flp pilus assembly protein CpaB [Moraxellaceae bacterium]
MNSKLLAAIAAVLLIGAVIAGYLGYQISTRESGPASAQAAENTAPTVKDGKVPVVVAARDINPGVPLKPEDLYVDSLRQAAPGSYQEVKTLVGKKPWVGIKAGALVSATDMQPGGELARLIRPDERAVAIAVDNVVGGGGYVSPGDYVDVLVFIRENLATGGTRETAQVVLPALRVLSYGTRMSRGGNETGSEDKKNEDESRSRTAVLAVPEKFATRLMLASNAGSLRLAVRSAESGFHERYLSGQSAESIVNDEMRSLIALSSLAPKSQSVVAAVKRPARSGEAPVTVYRGKDIQHVMQ